MFSVGHLSDLHVTPLRLWDVPRLINKRFFGWLSWMVRRRHHHRPEVLEALLGDLRAEAPDQIVLTGDLTNVALPREFAAARGWLERVGEPERVFAVPGNHDAYVSVSRAISWDLWAEYLRPDPDRAVGDDDFPTVRVRGPVAFVGVCSAVPSPVFRATGSVGPAQLERLEKQLGELGDAGLCRVVLLHHPPSQGVTSARRSLEDGDAFRRVLSRAGADLVLHGHLHRSAFNEIEGPRGPIPVVGVPSSSDFGQRPARRAQYHLYDIEPAPNARFRIGVRVRGWDAAAGRFVDEGQRTL